MHVRREQIARVWVHCYWASVPGGAETGRGKAGELESATRQWCSRSPRAHAGLVITLTAALRLQHDGRLQNDFVSALIFLSAPPASTPSSRGRLVVGAPPIVSVERPPQCCLSPVLQQVQTLLTGLPRRGAPPLLLTSRRSSGSLAGSRRSILRSDRTPRPRTWRVSSIGRGWHLDCVGRPALLHCFRACRHWACPTSWRVRCRRGGGARGLRSHEGDLVQGSAGVSEVSSRSSAARAARSYESMLRKMRSSHRRQR